MNENLFYIREFGEIPIFQIIIQRRRVALSCWRKENATYVLVGLTSSTRRSKACLVGVTSSEGEELCRASEQALASRTQR